MNPFMDEGPLLRLPEREPILTGSCQRPRILIAESRGFSRRALGQLQLVGDVELRDLDYADLLTSVQDATVLWVRLKHHIDEQVFRHAPQLKIVATPTTGLTHIDVEAATQHHIEILSLRGHTSFLKDIWATAELTVGLMLTLLRHIPAAHRHVLDGEWDRDRFQGREMHGKSVGIVGLGRLGHLVAQCLQGFGVHILAADPALSSADCPPNVTLLPLQNMLPQCDIVSLHANLTADSRGFFGEREFSAMKHGALFINTARGELLDEKALLAALTSQRLAGAAVDVISDETTRSPSHHQLLEYARSHPSLVITPHIGGCTVESMEKTEYYLAKQLRERLLQDLLTENPSLA